MKKIMVFSISAALITTAVMAHEDVKNPAVKARMDLMQDIRQSFGVLGKMYKGAAEYETAAAEAARAALIEHAEAIPAAFEAPETDPKTTAKEDIWSDWETFAAKATDMATAAEALDVTSLEALKEGFGPLSKSCGGCHQNFRVKK